jgi:hypothetical protein
VVAVARGTAGVKFDYVHPDKLRFDPSNPRFSEEGPATGQGAIQDLLEKAPHFALELIPSFLENGFIDYEPLVVRAVADHYVVVEGNRRLAAIRHILAKRPEYELKSTRLDDLAARGTSRVSYEQRRVREAPAHGGE